MFILLDGNHKKKKEDIDREDIIVSKHSNNEKSILATRKLPEIENKEKDKKKKKKKVVFDIKSPSSSSSSESESSSSSESESEDEKPSKVSSKKRRDIKQ